jgi:SnoaL-like domain
MSTEPNRSAAFRHAIEGADLPAILATLAPDVVFHSPIVHKPYVGRDAVGFVLGGVIQLFTDFHYTAVYVSPTGAVLQFHTRVGDRELEGADFLTFGADGLIHELTVMVRPYSAATALKDAMAALLAASTQVNAGSGS